MAAIDADGADAYWTEAFARTIDAAQKYVVSSTLDRVDWNEEVAIGLASGNARVHALTPQERHER